MKARVKATGEIVEVKYSRQIGPDAVYRDLVTGEHYMDFELSFLPEDGTPDYWTRLEHQYTGQFMQAMISSSNYIDVSEEAMADASFRMAHALVEKYKKEDLK